MTEISDRYRRLSGAFADRIAAVPDDGWDAPTPCEEWTARDLVGHVVQSQGMFLSRVGREAPEVDAAADPLGAWQTVSGVVQADLEDPERAATTFQGMFGEQTFEGAVDRFLNFDLVVHGWDLARASGQDVQIDADDLTRLDAASQEFGDAMRGPQAFGPALEVGPDAEDQTRVLAFLGRRR